MQARVATMVNRGRGAAMSEDDHSARDAALELSAQPQLIVTRTGVLGYANIAARALFDIRADQIGSPLAELRVARQPLDLVGPVEQAITDRKRVALGEIDFNPPNGEQRTFDVSVSPLISPGNVALGALVVFEDISRFAQLRSELGDSRRNLEAAYEELQSTIDELETTNEELQSANEELQTTNEELQSTNEELETMNEELHSTNQELETINDELRERTGELNNVNDFLESILTSLGVAVAVHRPPPAVQIWNRGAEELWGVRQDETADQHFLALDIGLEPERLAPALRAVISGASPQGDAAARRREPPWSRRRVRHDGDAAARRAATDGLEVRGAIVLMEDHDAAHDAAQDGHK